jgi:lipoprotein-anchoring transpeptidase ErfK/SrfK
MAMKKIILYIILPLIVVIGGAAVYLFMATGVKLPTKDETPMVFDTNAANLPKDDKAAKKELQNARKALAKVKPAKPYIVIDTHANRIFLRTEDSVILESTCSTGSGGEYVDSTTGRHWIFDTPRGVFKVNSKIPHPWWRKPDWAFLEEGEAIPKSEDERYDPNMMGDFAMGFGDGYFIHGTIYERLLGINVTHGCVRVGSDDLEKLYNKSPMGTYVYIF